MTEFSENGKFGDVSIEACIEAKYTNMKPLFTLDIERTVTDRTKITVAVEFGFLNNSNNSTERKFRMS